MDKNVVQEQIVKILKKMNGNLEIGIQALEKLEEIEFINVEDLLPFIESNKQYFSFVSKKIGKTVFEGNIEDQSDLQGDTMGFLINVGNVIHKDKLDINDYTKEFLFEVKMALVYIAKINLDYIARSKVLLLDLDMNSNMTDEAKKLYDENVEKEKEINELIESSDFYEENKDKKFIDVFGYDDEEYSKAYQKAISQGISEEEFFKKYNPTHTKSNKGTDEDIADSLSDDDLLSEFVDEEDETIDWQFEEM